jgi:hypothetical protein
MAVSPVRVHVDTQASFDWPVVFGDMVLHQREIMNKAFERYRFAKQFLFPVEKQDGRTYMTKIEQGLERFERLVLDQQRYIDFGSGKEVAIVGPHGQSSALIAFLESTNRALADFQRFLDRTTTPEAVERKCLSLPPDQCMSPCHNVRGKVLGKVLGEKCGFL